MSWLMRYERPPSSGVSTSSRHVTASVDDGQQVILHLLDGLHHVVGSDVTVDHHREHSEEHHPQDHVGERRELRVFVLMREDGRSRPEHL